MRILTHGRTRPRTLRDSGLPKSSPAAHAVDKDPHPDLFGDLGGIPGTPQMIGDMALEHGVPMAMHFVGTPVASYQRALRGPATRNSPCAGESPIGCLCSGIIWST